MISSYYPICTLLHFREDNHIVDYLTLVYHNLVGVFLKRVSASISINTPFVLIYKMF
jgi:hypothetical protein